MYRCIVKSEKGLNGINGVGKEREKVGHLRYPALGLGGASKNSHGEWRWLMKKRSSVLDLGV